MLNMNWLFPKGMAMETGLKKVIICGTIAMHRFVVPGHPCRFVFFRV